MTVRAVQGGAGCGKTHRLMAMLAETLEAKPLVDGQRVLALTFMHGARRRLSDRLRSVPGLDGRRECTTIDGFAWRISRRWRGLANSLGLPPVTEEQFNAVCDTAGALLEQPVVAKWVASSFPIILVDEGQDLGPERLRMLVAISQSVELLAAADEFQCLDQTLRPNPFVAWLGNVCEPEGLVHVHRTNRPGLLTAATAIRAGNAPANGQGFKILTGAGDPLAATMLANAIAWRQGDDVAVITPAVQGGYAQRAVIRVGQGAIGQHGNGPFSIRWEGTDHEMAGSIVAALNLPDVADAVTTLQALGELPPSGPARAAVHWVRKQVDACGRVAFSRADVERVISRSVTFQRQHGHSQSHDFVAMTVQQAKNREFDGVVVFWPYQVGGDAEQKRRLLYNAVTRAKRWCNVIVQSPNILNGPPFT
ncbi:hypothetical protein EAO27_18670 [Sphingopyxis sp. YF1]|uniref:ATP-binding domain-containing protein n=1 Tax=Sphingopyxis sp. YF1 TaxID=2482763 RepID=UPI001F619564|nr:ATP-dependent helicase [Sphingopyxis sp. YF1]UNU44508.1 hypothetical protein EAO27_18670 [Sphingopyxis sp. YF1]